MGRMADKTTGQAKGRTPVAAAPLPAPLASASAGARRGMPLSVVIVRYFAYLAVALCLVWFVTFALFSWMMRLGFVYSANYGSGNVGATVDSIRAASSFSEDVVPTAYRYVLVDADGTVLESDLAGERLDVALDVARDLMQGAGDAGQGTVAPQTGSEMAESHDGANPSAEPALVTGSGGATYAVFDLADGTTCVLVSTYMPQFVSRDLRDALPNPQNMMLAAGGLASIMAVALVARRAGRVIARKMGPLTEAAGRVACGDLDFAVGTSNVREINDVLAAMERMRASLAESLDARWRAEQAQRDQIAALAHDLKTPLTVVRANAEYVAEEARDMAGLASSPFYLPTPESNCASPGHDPTPATGPLGDRLADLAAAADDAACGTERLDAYVRLLIEVSRGEAMVGELVPVEATTLADEVRAAAEPLMRAAKVRLDFEQHVASCTVCADLPSLVRAVMNVVSNACDHAPAGGMVGIMFQMQRGRTVSADGPAGDTTPAGDTIPTDDAAGAVAGGGHLVITVEDDGPGFSPKALEHGCERFFRGDAARSGAALGKHYGIGLASASDIIRAHGGNIELANRLDARGVVTGARVTMRVPVIR